jgi:hypothetical protein
VTRSGSDSKDASIQQLRVASFESSEFAGVVSRRQPHQRVVAQTLDISVARSTPSSASRRMSLSV